MRRARTVRLPKQPSYKLPLVQCTMYKFINTCVLYSLVTIRTLAADLDYTHVIGDTARYMMLVAYVFVHK